MGFSTLNTARSALSAVLPPVAGRPVGEHVLVSRLLKGVKSKRPSLPRYNYTWDPNVVTNFLKQATNDTLRDLTLNLTMLMALVTGQRAQTLHALKVSDMEFDDDSITFTLSSPLKTRGPGVSVHFKAFSNPKLCVVNLIHQYLAKTKDIRKDDRLLLSFIKPYAGVTCDTVRRWIVKVMARAGIDTRVFKAHSTRAAATSAARRKDVPLAAILKAVLWKSENTFVKFYNRPVRSCNQSFAEGVLS